jgi:hypothetical protein
MCWSCTAGTATYEVPLYAQRPSDSKESLANESLRVCRIIVSSWGEDAKACVVKSCEQTSCVLDEPSPPRVPSVGYCDRHPEEPGCEKYCDAHPGAEECGVNYCNTHPFEPLCRQ